MSAPPSQPMPGVQPGPGQRPEHQQIAALDKEIDDELARIGLPATPPPACAQTRCAASSPLSVTVPPFATDPACRPPASDACKTSCTLSDSICANAERICELAKQLGGADAYANDRCARGKTSCETAHAHCCSCQR